MRVAYLLSLVFATVCAAESAREWKDDHHHVDKYRKDITEMTTDSIKQWKVALSHVTKSCTKEVAQAFTAAEIAFPGVIRPVIYRASGSCNDEIFEAFRKYFGYGKVEFGDHNTFEMENPDLSFFEELYAESDGLDRKIEPKRTGPFSDANWRESIFILLLKVTSHIPDECREETGLLFDVGVGESLDIGFVDGKKNFKITKECAKHSYKALARFFKRLRQLEAAGEIKEALDKKSKLLHLIDVWKGSKEASPEPKKVKPAYIPERLYPLSVMPMPLLRVPHSKSPPPEENLDKPRDLESREDVDTPQEGFSVLPPVQLENFALESRRDVDTPQEGFSVLPPVQLENFALESRNDVDTPQEGFSVLPPVQLENFAERIAPIEAKLEEPVNIPVIEVKKLEVPVHAPLKQFKKLYASPIDPAIQREDEKDRIFESEGNGGDDTPKFWPHYHSESAKK